MPTYQITTTVVYVYEVDADGEEQAEKLGWQYEDYQHYAEVDSIEVLELEPDQVDEQNQLTCMNIFSRGEKDLGISLNCPPRVAPPVTYLL